MFVSITTTDLGDASAADGPIVAEEMDRWLADIEGYEGFVLLTGARKALGLVFWESREVAERHSVARTQFRERMLAVAGVTIESVEGYDVAYSSLGRDVGPDG